MSSPKLILITLTLLNKYVKSEAPGLSRQYWTAFINVSYHDVKNSVMHTESTETGRYSTDVVRSARGLAVELKGINTGKMNRSKDELLNACNPPFNTSRIPTGEPWVAIIRRGGCPFNLKIVNAVRLNASAVVIYDNVKATNLESMKVKIRNIPSIFTYKWKGLELLNRTRSFEKVYIGFQKGSHCRMNWFRQLNSSSLVYCTPLDNWDDFHQILQKQSPFWTLNHNNLTLLRTHHTFDVEKRTSVLFVSVSFIILMIISMAWLVFYYVQRFRYIHQKDKMERKLCLQAKKALNIISTITLKKGDLIIESGETCAICIETYKIGDVVRILPCKHEFHKNCIDQWLVAKRTCPMCKMDILKHYGLAYDTPEDEIQLETPIDVNLIRNGSPTVVNSEENSGATNSRSDLDV